MSKPRTSKCISAIFAGILASAAVATVSHAQTRAADDCLSAPKEGAPDGSHWYYRVDRATKRHCWYLRRVGEKLSQIRAPSSKSTPPQPEAATQRLVADAHAELPVQTSVDQPSGKNRPTQADAGRTETRSGPAVGEAMRSVVAARWPEPPGLSSPVSPRPPADNLPANVQPNSAAPPSPPVAGVVPLAAADSSPQDQFRSVPMLLSAIAGVLALAGITAGLALKFLGARRAPRAKVRRRPGSIWEPTDDDTIVLSDSPASDVVSRRSGFARDLDHGGGNRRTSVFFSHVSKRTPA